MFKRRLRWPEEFDRVDFVGFVICSILFVLGIIGLFWMGTVQAKKTRYQDCVDTAIYNRDYDAIPKCGLLKIKGDK